MPTYTIYSITMSNGSYKYVGMTTQNLQKRLTQHKADARSGSCSLSNRLCQKRKPRDLQVLHTKLNAKALLGQAPVHPMIHRTVVIFCKKK